MTQLATLPRAAWAATLAAARVLKECNPHDAEDRARFRAAKAELVTLLPEGADASDLIAQGVRFYALDDVAQAFMGMQAELPDVAVLAGAVR